MPLLRYFSFVGGVLLALLFILDAYLPKLAVPDGAPDNLPVIRIHSDRKWPERIVYDTSHPPIVPKSVASPEVIIQAPKMTAEASASPRKLEAFAMLPPPGEQSQPSNTKPREPRARHQSKIVRKRPPVPGVAVARYLQFSQFRPFGWSGRSFW